MIDQLESELRSALRARADELPADASARVRAHEYRPRTRDLRPPVAAGVLTTAAAAAAVVALIDLGPQAPAAFAGWSATPTPASPAQVAGAQGDCAKQLADIPPLHDGHVTSPGTPQPPPVPRFSKLSQTAPVLTDTRGPFTFVVFDSAQAHASCISGPGFTSTSLQSSTQARVSVSAGRIAPAFLVHTARAGDAYTFVEGHAGAGVTAATLILSDGSRVQTTLQNGWLVAWWPGAAQLTSARVSTAAGTTTQALGSKALYGCPAPPSGGTPGLTTMGVANCAASLAAGTRQAAGSASMNSTGAGGRAGGTVTSGTGG
ncbi:MAG TPA: hypothetical protein VGG07_25905 [Solirubrobacteraceae bacterium]|jgi:hypothetical protein